MKVALLLILAGTCLAQDAQVYDLQPTETAEGKRLYKEMNDSKQAYDDWVEKMGVKYFFTDNCLRILGEPDFGTHFEARFDASFKHAVRRYPYVNGCAGGGFAITPLGDVTTVPLDGQLHVVSPQ